MAKLLIDGKVNVIVNLSKRSTVRNSFDLGLLIGTSPTLKEQDKRVAIYTTADALLDAGFSKESPEYKGADIYFQQKPKPQRVAVAYWDKDGEEDLVDAVKAARDANTEWYITMPAVELTEDEALLLSAWCETVKPATLYSCGTSSYELAAKLNGLERANTIITYSEEQPVEIAIGIIGRAMGMQTGAANSAYTLDCKNIYGVEVDDLDDEMVGKLKAIYTNYYVCRGSTYNLYEEGWMADGTWFDERINLDKMVNDIQLAVMDLYTTARKVPPTNEGVEMVRSAIKPAMDLAVKIGFVGPGVWTEDDVLSLKTGDMLPKGYIILNDSVNEQAAIDRENRIMVPFYIPMKLKGATHSATIQLVVNR